MGFFAQMFSEPGGGSPSSTRALTAFVVVAIVGMWALVSFRNNKLEHMTTEHVAIVACALGFKVWQRGKENGHTHGQTTQTVVTTKTTDTQPPFPVK